MNPWDAFISRQSERCPGCTHSKKPGRSVCGHCWHQLTPELEAGLRNPIHKQAHADALEAAITHIQSKANA